ncbi:HAMP domain-containing histidine kinase [Pseudoalteromonas luteoviolacea]|uniref:sensor histidine kinase n=1 Tax=Pseudoalteromonas luteoviolacea TaxID=43657 RepID=UPI001B37B74F|nr:HAMP domain-containing sensor histidine kinase [Pseudoalteromonas luteoviolacea]MBQ4810555.1 HAMP domain-containing histidine kinase [Pseudoalteromonas luteoviolacea]
MKSNRNDSLARKLFLLFTVLGCGVFALIAGILFLFSINFANIAVEKSMHGMAEDIPDTLHFDERGALVYTATNIAKKWGYDALFNNLAFKVSDSITGDVLLTSNPHQATSVALLALPQSMPEGYSFSNGIDRYRIAVEIQGRALFVDLARDDMIGELANEAVLPMLGQVLTLTMVSAFLIFIFVGYISIKAVVKPVKNVASQLDSIEPSQLDRRLDKQGVPSEMLPLVNALNDTMDRVETGFNEQKRFVANAAHELKTPLAVLRTRLELANLPDKIGCELMGDITYMTRVVEQLLDLSRAQNQNSYLHKSVNISDVAKDVCMLLGPLTLTYKKDLALEEIDKNATVIGDQAALIIMLKNLLENALKHAEEGAQIIVEVACDRISVKDSGPGINEADRVKLFERFWRKEQSTLTGSGLGLAIVNEVVIAHNARIDVECNNDMGGATFHVYFYDKPY